MKPLRVLIWHEQNPSVSGGAESWVADTATALRARGHEVAWLHSTQILEALARFRPDRCLLGTLHNYVGLEHVERLRERGIPGVWFAHDYWPMCVPRMLMRDGNKSDLPCPAALDGECDNHCGGKLSNGSRVMRGFKVATGCEGAAAILRRHGLAVDYVVEESVDTDLFHPASPCAESANYVIASAAWNAPWKGMAVAEEALVDTGLELRLLTGLSRDDVAAALREATLFVMPSLYQEIWGLALTEAMASGLACVASDVAGCRAQMHDGLGLLVPPHNPEALREALLWLRDHPRERREMGERARAHVTAEHSLAMAGQRWEEVLGECAV